MKCDFCGKPANWTLMMAEEWEKQAKTMKPLTMLSKAHYCDKCLNHKVTALRKLRKQEGIIL